MWVVEPFGQQPSQVSACRRLVTLAEVEADRVGDSMAIGVWHDPSAANSAPGWGDTGRKADGG
jgi:hypothetical protein